MSKKRDYYEVLGVAKDAAVAEIKVSYRKLAVQYHPDRNPGDAEAEEKFKEAAEAYAVLSDAEKRARYDRFGHQSGPQGFSGADFDPSAFGDFAFSPDSQWLFWTWRAADSRPARIYRRAARGGQDVLVYEEPDPGFLIGVSLSASRGYIVIRSWNDVTSEVRLIAGSAPTATPLLVAPRAPGLSYAVDHWRDRFVIRTATA